MSNASESLQKHEAECAEGRTAPRVFLADIEDQIQEQFFVLGSEALQSYKPVPEGFDVLTLCFILMRNGFTIVGKSAPASPANFNLELGRKLAYDDAIRQLWPLMGFSLRDRLSQG